MVGGKLLSSKYTNDDENHLHECMFTNSLLKGVKNIFILWLISKQQIHGYGIMSKINDTNNNLNIKNKVHTSTIYPILHSLEEKGLIKSTEVLHNNHKVKMYEITSEGTKTLNSIKSFTKTRPVDDLLLSFMDDMLFNGEKLIQMG